MFPRVCLLQVQMNFKWEYPHLKCFREEDNNISNEYCFGEVDDQLGAAINDQCENVDNIAEANSQIQKANVDMAKEVERENAATEAIDVAANIRTELSSGRRNHGRAAQTTLEPITTCAEFANSYDVFLDILSSLGDDNTARIKQYSLILAAALTLAEFPCSSEKKKELKENTQAKSEKANLRAKEYKQEKKKAQKALILLVQTALAVIQNSNTQLELLGLTTKDSVTLSFTIPTQSTVSTSTTSPIPSMTSSTASSTTTEATTYTTGETSAPSVSVTKISKYNSEKIKINLIILVDQYS